MIISNDIAGVLKTVHDFVAALNVPNWSPSVHQFRFFAHLVFFFRFVHPFSIIQRDCIFHSTIGKVAAEDAQCSAIVKQYVTYLIATVRSDGFRLLFIRSLIASV